METSQLLATPPTILSSTSLNKFRSVSELEGVVKNPSTEETSLLISTVHEQDGMPCPSEYIVPPRSAFILCTLPLSQAEPLETPIPGLPSSQRFNLMLFDPPWPNRSVRRSKGYQTHAYDEMDILSQRLQDILRVHAFCPNGDSTDTVTAPGSQLEHSSQESFAAIWITNSERARKVAYESLLASGFRIQEEWIWIKVTANGEPVCPLNGLWRKPYEILIIGRKDSASDVLSDPGCAISPTNLNSTDDLLGVDPSTISRRVIAAVPDLHSRKPNLKPLFERILFGCTSGSDRKSYSALEVFARSLTSEWWACGNEAVKFNGRDCWVEHDDSV
ncbi:hypothetical protein N7454_007105 [Penicillium verhagenii]|nr:hypothetical protein N7454_007105 [Penicillium verhagenii]